MRIAVSANYTIPATLSQVAIKDGLYIDVDSTDGPVTITLPKVSDYKRDQVIYIIDAGGASGENVITVVADATEESENYIDGDANKKIIDAYDSIVLTSSKTNNWTTQKVMQRTRRLLGCISKNTTIKILADINEIGIVDLIDLTGGNYKMVLPAIYDGMPINIKWHDYKDSKLYFTWAADGSDVSFKHELNGTLDAGDFAVRYFELEVIVVPTHVPAQQLN